MKTVGDLLKVKGHRVWSVAPASTVLEALRLMAEKDVGALLVMQGETVVGLISERDYARKVFLKGKSSPGTPVREIMTERVLAVSPDRTIEECMVLMTAHRVRHLPVMEGGRIAGLISIGDVVKASIEEKDFLIKQLENYITGSS